MPAPYSLASWYSTFHFDHKLVHILNPWPLCTRYLATGIQVIITIIKFYHNARIELLQFFFKWTKLRFNISNPILSEIQCNLFAVICKLHIFSYDWNATFFSGQTSFDNVIVGSSIKEVLEKIEAKESLALKKIEITAQKIALTSQDIKVCSLLQFKDFCKRKYTYLLYKIVIYC